MNVSSLAGPFPNFIICVIGLMKRSARATYVARLFHLFHRCLKTCFFLFAYDQMCPRHDRIVMYASTHREIDVTPFSGWATTAVRSAFYCMWSYADARARTHTSQIGERTSRHRRCCSFSFATFAKMHRDACRTEGGKLAIRLARGAARDESR